MKVKLRDACANGLCHECGPIRGVTMARAVGFFTMLLGLFTVVGFLTLVLAR